MTSFPKFMAELKKHSAKGYHSCEGPVDREVFKTWCEAHAVRPPEAYADFMTTIGPGVFFSGYLTIYALSSASDRSVESELNEIQTLRNDGIMSSTTKLVLPIGYDGSTVLSWCVSVEPDDSRVFWLSWEEAKVRVQSKDFIKWIESQPKKLFSEQSYAGYREIRDPAGVQRVIEDRSAISVELIDVNMKLERQPEKPDAFLPRYNRLTLRVTKHRPVSLHELTIPAMRVGSQYGERNVNHFVIPIGDIPVGQPAEVIAYVFDSYAIPFEDIEINYSPFIDTSSPRRTAYKELDQYL